MTIPCPTCFKVNPPEARYCYYDGSALAHGFASGPLGLGALSFPRPFSFADGKSCANFNQLVLACDGRWLEARNFLADGTWKTFFSSIGRVDLAMIANQAAREGDLDVGLAYLMERLPADANALRPPKLAPLPAVHDLGALEPATDHRFDLAITNHGMLILRGSVTTDCDWLAFGERQGTVSTKLFQTRATYTLVVRVLGNMLRAGRKPLEGYIAIETNGGRDTIIVRAIVPVHPFPTDQAANPLFAEVTSPRELAVKAKAHPQEAAVLFERGLVQAWYASNGWTYPVQGPQGRGKGAVQQFFEALGLTRPPHLEISTERICCQGEAGQRLTRNVIISSKEPKFVYAAAHSDQSWVQVQPDTAQGNSVTIPLCIEVPHRPRETLHAQVTIQGNGQQQFVVPVTLTVGANGAQSWWIPDSPAVPPATATPVASGANPEGRKARLALRSKWVVAGVGLVLVLAVCMAVVIKGRRGGDEVQPPPIVTTPPPAQPPATTATWWDDIPDTHFAASVAKLTESAAENQALFAGLSSKSDLDRFKEYERLADKLPHLASVARTREPLGQFITESCVHEPSALNLEVLLRGLTRQFPPDGGAFPTADQGAEVERAFFWLKVVFDAITHKAVRPDRRRILANQLGAVFGFALDTSAPVDELKANTEKLLAVRCFRNTVPTATKAIEPALAIRTVLLARFPQHLAPDFRDQVDVELLAIGLARGSDLWPMLEPLARTAVESNQLHIGLKVLSLYEKANPELAAKLEVILASKWKPVGNPMLTHAAKVTAIRKSLAGHTQATKTALADRAAQWRKLTEMPADKPDLKQENKLQDTVRLALVSTLGSILFAKEPDLERFDALLGKNTAIEQGPAANKERKNPDEKPPPVQEVVTVDAGPWNVQDELTAKSERDPRRRAFRKAYSVAMKAGQFYTIEMRSAALNSYLRLESAAGVQLAVDDDSGGFPHARIVFAPKADGVYRVIATSSVKEAVGPFTLQIQAGGGFGGFGFGVLPPRIGIRPAPFFPVPPGGLMGVPAQEGPKGMDNKAPPLNLSDLNDLANKQSNVRAAAFNNLAGNLLKSLSYHHAQKMARYLLLTIRQDAEFDAVSGKLDSLAKCPELLQALADTAASEGATQQRTEAVVGGVLGQALRFARDEDWRSAIRKLLLQRALELTRSPGNDGDQAAAYLRELYKEQGLAFGLDDPGFLKLTQLSQVLEALIKHVAANTANQDLPAADKDLLHQVGRQLQAARFVADNDLQHVVLLQRIWIKVLILALRQMGQSKVMQDVQEELQAQDRLSRNVLEQLRSGEEKILRIWALAHKTN